jgi:RNA polymerase sigma factor for flagellar operon FliA
MAEKDLWAAYQRSGTLAARNELVLHYQPILLGAARAVAAKLPRHVELSELVAMGTVGLIEAVERFDPEAGFQFATFAMWRVRGSILDGMRTLDGASRSQRRRTRELGDIADSLSQLQRRTITPEEAAEIIGCHRGVGSASFPRTVSWEDLPGEVPAVFGHEERTDLELLISETKLLNASERTAVYLSFFCDHSLAEIGALLGVTESRACQVRKAALAKLRKAVEQGERSHVFLEAVK